MNNIEDGSIQSRLRIAAAALLVFLAGATWARIVAPALGSGAPWLTRVGIGYRTNYNWDSVTGGCRGRLHPDYIATVGA